MEPYSEVPSSVIIFSLCTAGIHALSMGAVVPQWVQKYFELEAVNGPTLPTISTAFGSKSGNSAESIFAASALC